MFADAIRSATNEVSDDTGPPILTSEVKQALKAAKNRKALGPDDILVEVLKLLGDDYVDALTNLFTKIR